MALENILEISDKQNLDLDDEAIKRHVHNNLPAYQELIAY